MVFFLVIFSLFCSLGSTAMETKKRKLSTVEEESASKKMNTGTAESEFVPYLDSRIYAKRNEKFMTKEINQWIEGQKEELEGLQSQVNQIDGKPLQGGVSSKNILIAGISIFERRKPKKCFTLKLGPFVSGWPSKKIRGHLGSQVIYPSSFFEKFDARYHNAPKDQKQKDENRGLIAEFKDRLNYQIREEGNTQLAPERLEDHERTLEKYGSDMGEFQKLFAHTEHTVFLQLQQPEILQAIAEQMKENQDYDLVLHMLSKNSSCFRCADRCFMESEQETGFLERLKAKFSELKKGPGNIQLIPFFFFERPYEDCALSDTLKTFYRGQKDATNLVGFKNGTLDFFNVQDQKSGKRRQSKKHANHHFLVHHVPLSELQVAA